MTDKQINKFSDLTFAQFLGYDLVATFNNNRKIKELQEQLKRKEQECNQLKAYIKEDLVPHAKLYKKALKEVKEIAQYDVYTSRTDLCIKLNWVKKKISEVIKDEE